MELNKSLCRGGTWDQAGHQGLFYSQHLRHSGPAKYFGFCSAWDGKPLERHDFIFLWLPLGREFMEERLARVEVGRPVGTFFVTETPFPTVAHLVNMCSTFTPWLKGFPSYGSLTKHLPSPLQNWPTSQRSPVPVTDTYALSPSLTLSLFGFRFYTFSRL